MRLGEILVQRGKATPEQIAAAQEALAGSALDVGAVLVEQGVLSEADRIAALAEMYGLEFLAEVSDEHLDPDLVGDLPVEWARNHGMLPIRHRGRAAVLTSDPARISEQDDLALLMGAELLPILATPAEIRRSIERCYFRRTDSASDFIRDLGAAGEGVVSTRREGDDLLRTPGEAPVTQLVNLILLEAVKARASDVHVEPFEDRLRVRYRVDGLLYEQASPPKHLEAALVSRLKVMGRLDIAEKRLPQDGMARVRVGEREIDIRVATIPVAEGERVVLRLLNQESALLPLTALGMPDNVLAQFRAMIREPYGALWVTGPTGSGKTTTLYAALQELDTAHLNVLTIEDPIEYQLPNIGQIAVKPKIGLTFAQGLRHILRQDPDVILVGETRDLETAEIAVRASLTGHVVFSTLHTNDAASAIVRLVDMGIPPYLLSAATRGALAQRLLRALCPECREAAALSADERAALGPWAGKLAGKKVWRPRGCPACLGGYRGRTGIFEFLPMNEGLRAALRGGVDLQNLRALAHNAGMTPLMEDALHKVLEGKTGVSEMLRALGRAEIETAGA
ncbi:MAG: Flp pilus assembly complex ATPase component TadA [Kiritimatiellae bacterium]|nr:Flp pilus assembly complex ATPase component TadA [Kiritimatiellia bacterium]